MIRHGRSLDDGVRVLDIIREGIASTDEGSSNLLWRARETSLRKIILAIQSDQLTWSSTETDGYRVSLKSEFEVLRERKLEMSIVEGLQYWACWHQYIGYGEDPAHDADLAERYLILMESALDQIISSRSDFPGDQRQRERAVQLL